MRNTSPMLGGAVRSGRPWLWLQYRECSLDWLRTVGCGRFQASPRPSLAKSPTNQGTSRIELGRLVAADRQPPEDTRPGSHH